MTGLDMLVSRRCTFMIFGCFIIDWNFAGLLHHLIFTKIPRFFSAEVAVLKLAVQHIQTEAIKMSRSDHGSFSKLSENIDQSTFVSNKCHYLMDKLKDFWIFGTFYEHPSVLLFCFMYSSWFLSYRRFFVEIFFLGAGGLSRKYVFRIPIVS